MKNIPFELKITGIISAYSEEHGEDTLKEIYQDIASICGITSSNREITIGENKVPRYPPDIDYRAIEKILYFGIKKQIIEILSDIKRNDNKSVLVDVGDYITLIETINEKLDFYTDNYSDTLSNTADSMVSDIRNIIKKEIGE